MGLRHLLNVHLGNHYMETAFWYPHTHSHDLSQRQKLSKLVLLEYVDRKVHPLPPACL